MALPLRASRHCSEDMSRLLERRSDSCQTTANHERTGPITTDFVSKGPLFLAAFVTWRSIVIALGIIRNQQVVGSNPTGGSKEIRYLGLSAARISFVCRRHVDNRLRHGYLAP